MYHLEIRNSYDRLKIVRVNDDESEEELFEIVCGTDTDRVVVTTEVRTMADSDGFTRTVLYG